MKIDACECDWLKRESLYVCLELESLSRQNWSSPVGSSGYFINTYFDRLERINGSMYLACTQDRTEEVRRKCTKSQVVRGEVQINNHKRVITRG